MKIEEIEKRIDAVERVLEKKEQDWDYSRPWEEYQEHCRPERKELANLGRELRLIKPYELQELSDYGDVMSIEHFTECVNEGGFIDYDGFGYYVKDGKESDIEIYPSDVKHNKVRKDFDTIIWFNR